MKGYTKAGISRMRDRAGRQPLQSTRTQEEDEDDGSDMSCSDPESDDESDNIESLLDNTQTTVEDQTSNFNLLPCTSPPPEYRALVVKRTCPLLRPPSEDHVPLKKNHIPAVVECAGRLKLNSPATVKVPGSLNKRAPDTTLPPAAQSQTFSAQDPFSYLPVKVCRHISPKLINLISPFRKMSPHVHQSKPLKCLPLLRFHDPLDPLVLVILLGQKWIQRTPNI